MDGSELTEVLFQIMPEKKGKSKYLFIMARGKPDLSYFFQGNAIQLKAVPVLNNYKLFLLSDNRNAITKIFHGQKDIDLLTIFNGTFLKICEYSVEMGNSIAGINMEKRDGSIVNLSYRDGTNVDIDSIHKFRSSGYKINSLTISNGSAELVLNKDFSIEASGKREESAKLISEISIEALSVSLEAFERIEKCVFRSGNSLGERTIPVTFHLSQKNIWETWERFLSNMLLTWRIKLSHDSELAIFRQKEGNSLIRCYLENDRISILPMASTSIGMIGKLAEEIEDMGGVFVA
jgi:hypothetical protein